MEGKEARRKEKKDSDRRAPASSPAIANSCSARTSIPQVVRQRESQALENKERERLRERGKGSCIQQFVDGAKGKDAKKKGIHG